MTKMEIYARGGVNLDEHMVLDKLPPKFRKVLLLQVRKSTTPPTNHSRCFDLRGCSERTDYLQFIPPAENHQMYKPQLMACPLFLGLVCKLNTPVGIPQLSFQWPRPRIAYCCRQFMIHRTTRSSPSWPS